MKYLYWFVAITWELPQTILAGLIYVWLRITNRISELGIVYTRPIYNLLIETDGDLDWGVSLGRLTFLNTRVYQAIDVVHHEYGHSIQSLMLGPLYLIVVGLPSVTMNILTRLRILPFHSYYDRWPENWADRLGSVDR